jgi:hypothetical protein
MTALGISWYKVSRDRILGVVGGNDVVDDDDDDVLVVLVLAPDVVLLSLTLEPSDGVVVDVVTDGVQFSLSWLLKAMLLLDVVTSSCDVLMGGITVVGCKLDILTYLYRRLVCPVIYGHVRVLWIDRRLRN